MEVQEKAVLNKKTGPFLACGPIDPLNPCGCAKP